MLLEIPITIGATVVAAMLSAPGVARFVGWTAADGTPYQASLVGAVVGLMAFLMLTLVADPEAFADEDAGSGTVLVALAVTLFGVYLTLGAAGGLSGQGPMRMAFVAFTLLLSAVTLRFVGQCALAFWKGRAKR